MLAARVALRKESVDRNDAVQIVIVVVYAVALRKESVDRNISALASYNIIAVALRKESVDRNIIGITTVDRIIDVALRKESVDRNPENPMISVNEITSLSARRAWIEIVLHVNGAGLSNCRSPQGERG